MLEAEAEIPFKRRTELVEESLRNGLQPAWSITDRTIPRFDRNPMLNGKYSSATTFLGVPFQEDMRALESPDVVFVGAPLDAGTTYRSGTRFGPEGIRSISSLYSGYNFEFGVDLVESLEMVDAGDITVIPANIEKSFDQIDKGVAYLHEHGTFPVVLGGDHAIGYPRHPRPGAICGWQYRHHPLRPAHRYVRAQYRRAHARHAVLPRHQYSQRATGQSGSDRDRRLEWLAHMA